MKTINILISFFLCSAIYSNSLYAQDFTKIWEFADFGEHVGIVDLQLVDANNDGKDEIILG